MMISPIRPLPSPEVLISYRKVAVFRSLKLGDMLCAVPALRALRAGMPTAEITLIGLPWARSFALRFQAYIDKFISFPGYPGLPEREFDMFEVREFLDLTSVERFDLALQMHGSGLVSNDLVELLGADVTAGFYPAAQPCPDPAWYLPYPDSLPEIDRNIALLQHIGIPAAGRDLEFPIIDEDLQELSRHPALRGLVPGSYICVHPGASVPDKCWPVDRFAKVARTLRGSGLSVVITGRVADSHLAARMQELLGRSCIDSTVSDLGIGALAFLIRKARLLLCNDTGVSHLASALRVPSVVVFTRSDPRRWAPGDPSLNRTVSGTGGTPPPVDLVAEAVRSLLTTEGVRQHA